MITAGTVLGALGAASQRSEQVAELSARVEALEGSVSALVDFAGGRMDEEAWTRIASTRTAAPDELDVRPWTRTMVQFFEDSRDMAGLGVGVESAILVYPEDSHHLLGKIKLEGDLVREFRRSVKLNWAGRMSAQFKQAKASGDGGAFRLDYEEARDIYADNRTAEAAIPRWSELVELFEWHQALIDRVTNPEDSKEAR